LGFVASSDRLQVEPEQSSSGFCPWAVAAEWQETDERAGWEPPFTFDQFTTDDEIVFAELIVMIDPRPGRIGSHVDNPDTDSVARRQIPSRAALTNCNRFNFVYGKLCESNDAHHQLQGLIN
jgi:hypothetical protein